MAMLYEKFEDFIAVLEGGDWSDCGFGTTENRIGGRHPRAFGNNPQLEGTTTFVSAAGRNSAGYSESHRWKGEMPLREAVLKMEENGALFNDTPR